MKKYDRNVKSHSNHFYKLRSNYYMIKVMKLFCLFSLWEQKKGIKFEATTFFLKKIDTFAQT